MYTPDPNRPEQSSGRTDVQVVEEVTRIVARETEARIKADLATAEHLKAMSNKLHQNSNYLMGIKNNIEELADGYLHLSDQVEDHEVRLKLLEEWRANAARLITLATELTQLGDALEVALDGRG